MDDSSPAVLFEEFRVARQSAKPSPHSERAARSDLAAIHARLEEILGVEEPTLQDVTPRALRLAFASFAVDHSAASIAGAWSTWNQFFAFLVAEDHVPGNPMGAVARPKTPRRPPKPLQGDDAPELLLQATAAGTRTARYPWPERDLAFLAISLLTGLRLCELLALNLGSIDGRPGERRIKVMGKGRKERTVPIEDPLYDIIRRYLDTRNERFPGVKLGPKAPLFVDRKGSRMREGAARYLVETSLRHAGLGGRVPQGALVHTSQGYIDATANQTRQAARANRTYRALERFAVGATSPQANGSDGNALQRRLT